MMKSYSLVDGEDMNNLRRAERFGRGPDHVTLSFSVYKLLLLVREALDFTHYHFMFHLMCANLQRIPSLRFADSH